MADQTPDGASVTLQHLPVPDTRTAHTPPKSPLTVSPQTTQPPELLRQKSFKRGAPSDFDPPPLTAAAALADERRLREAQEKSAKDVKDKTEAPKTSPNIARATVNALMATSAAPISRPSDKPVDTPAASSNTSARSAQPPLPTILTNSAPVAEPTAMQTSPFSISSQDGLHGTTSTAGGATVESPTAIDTPGGMLRPHDDGRSNKAVTYPPPQHMTPADRQDLRSSAARGMSLPDASYGDSPSRSGSTKKHKCPHCDTEFTRHHNLKSHLLTHSQEKPFVCQTCQARFRRLHDLKRHSKLHTGERPHICNRCGRKFARGDALARHNKGQGGCAGHRSSIGGEDDYGDGNSGNDDEMDGLVYHDASDGDPASNESPEIRRRKSEPDHKAIRSSMSSRIDPNPNANRQPTTYPGSAVAKGTSRGVQLPPASSGLSPRTRPQHLSPRPSASSLSSYINPSGQSVYANSNMTESPLPLSPGQADPHRMSIDSGYPRGRSPSMQQTHQQPPQGQFRGSGYGTPPNVLPPMTLPQPLPSLQSLGSDHRFGSGSSAAQASPASNGRGPLPGGGSGSHQSSGSSLREALNGTGNVLPPAGPSSSAGDMWEYIRSLESKFTRMQDDMQSALKHQEAHYEAQIGRLQDELKSLHGEREREQRERERERERERGHDWGRERERERERDRDWDHEREREREREPERSSHQKATNASGVS